MPKLELHVHLGGAVRYSTLLETFISQGREDPKGDADDCIISGIDARPPSKQMERFHLVGSAWSSWDDTKRWTRELIEDCEQLRTSGSSREKLESIIDVFIEHHKLKQFPIMKTWSVDEARAAALLAIDLWDNGKGYVVALDFCDDPTKGEFSKYAAIFKEAKSMGLPFTCHFAEGPGESDLSEILKYGPLRLGHATYMPDIIKQQVYQSKIPIEACLYSNINTMKLYKGLKDGHPIIDWYSKGHPFVLCTDNPGILNVTLTQHYTLLCKELELNDKQLWNLSLQSIDYIFAEDVKALLRQKFEEHPANPFHYK